VGCYEGLENGAMAGGLAPVVLGPLSPELPVAFGLVALDALLPKILARLIHWRALSTGPPEWRRGEECR
jgi:hypothetical protein